MHYPLPGVGDVKSNVVRPLLLSDGNLGYAHGRWCLSPEWVCFPISLVVAGEQAATVGGPRGEKNFFLRAKVSQPAVVNQHCTIPPWERKVLSTCLADHDGLRGRVLDH